MGIERDVASTVFNPLVIKGGSWKFTMYNIWCSLPGPPPGPGGPMASPCSAAVRYNASACEGSTAPPFATTFRSACTNSRALTRPSPSLGRGGVDLSLIENLYLYIYIMIIMGNYNNNNDNNLYLLIIIMIMMIIIIMGNYLWICNIIIDIDNYR